MNARELNARQLGSDFDRQDETTAIKHCLHYLHRESLRLGLLEAAGCIGAAIDAIEFDEDDRPLRLNA